jgi:hypothetical protein
LKNSGRTSRFLVSEAKGIVIPFIKMRAQKEKQLKDTSNGKLLYRSVVQKSELG